MHSTIPRFVSSTPKITFATTCMGRVEHLKDTVPANIAANLYPRAEFLLLNYNSPDDMDLWVAKAFAGRLGTVVNYYHENTSHYFHMSHAKNLAGFLSNGEIIVNIDADRLIVPTLGFLIADALNSPMTIARAEVNAKRSNWDASGLIACRRSDFLLLGGYDERMCYGWGCEDHDLISRAQALGYSVQTLEDCGKSLPHPAEKRNQFARDQLSPEASARLNGRFRLLTIMERSFVANTENTAGAAIVVKNFGRNRRSGWRPQPASSQLTS